MPISCFNMFRAVHVRRGDRAHAGVRAISPSITSSVPDCSPRSLQLLVVKFFPPTELCRRSARLVPIFGLLLAFGMLYPHEKVMLIFLPDPDAGVAVRDRGMPSVELTIGRDRLRQAGVAHFAHLGGMLGGYCADRVLARAAAHQAEAPPDALTHQHSSARIHDATPAAPTDAAPHHLHGAGHVPSARACSSVRPARSSWPGHRCCSPTCSAVR